MHFTADARDKLDNLQRERIARPSPDINDFGNSIR
jgi:hypothetical protein